VATLIWHYAWNTKRVNEAYSGDGTHHCPRCGSVVGLTKNGKTTMSTFHIQEGSEEEDLPNNVLPFRRNVRPVFDDDGPGAA